MPSGRSGEEYGFKSIHPSSIGGGATAGYALILDSDLVSSWGQVDSAGIAAGAIDEAHLSFDVATQAELDAHINDTTDAHDASAISILDSAADFAATDVEGALAELQADAEADATALADHLADAVGAHAATAISVDSTNLVGTSITVQGSLDELDNAIVAAETSISNHISDATDAHAGTAITNTPAGTISATTVQAAINELDTEKATTGSVTTVATDLSNHLSDTTDAHDASAISYVGGTGMSATDVEGAIDELADTAYSNGHHIVRCLHAANINIANPGTALLGGVTCVAGDRVMLYSQTSTTEKGIYVFDTSSTPMVRAGDWASGDTIPPGTMTTVANGTYGGNSWVTTNIAFVVGTGSPTFQRSHVSIGLSDTITGAKTFSAQTVHTLGFQANAQSNFIMTTPTTAAAAFKDDGDAGYRAYINASGGIYWGDGAGTYDVNLTRSAANILSIGSGDKIQQNAAPTTGDDLTNKTYVDAHINDTSDAHDASAISVDSSTLVGTGTDVQAVLEELDNAIVATETVANGAIPKSLIDAAGDLIYGSAADTAARLAAGSNGQVLTLAAGVPSWALASANLGVDVVNVPYASSPYTFTKASYPQATFAIVEVVGGGAGGGAAVTNETMGGGGGGGGYSREVIPLASMAANETVTIGAGGAGGVAGGAAAGAGGTTSFGAFLSATGGTAGAVDGGSFAASGVGSGGDVNLRGGYGGYGGINTYAGPDCSGGDAGGGFGPGAPTRARGGVGTTGLAIGGGGGGGHRSTATSRNGGAGIDGICIITLI